MSNLTPSGLFTLVLINSDSYRNLELPLKSIKQKQLEKNNFQQGSGNEESR
jgi:hypothetical protein